MADRLLALGWIARTETVFEGGGDGRGPDACGGGTGAPTVADELGFHSLGQCMRALGEAVRPLLSRFGDAKVEADLERFE